MNPPLPFCGLSISFHMYVSGRIETDLHEHALMIRAFPHLDADVRERGALGDLPM